jgi:hypothetical protein
MPHHAGCLKSQNLDSAGSELRHVEAGRIHNQFHQPLATRAAGDRHGNYSTNADGWECNKTIIHLTGGSVMWGTDEFRAEPIKFIYKTRYLINLIRQLSFLHQICPSVDTSHMKLMWKFFFTLDSFSTPPQYWPAAKGKSANHKNSVMSWHLLIWTNQFFQLPHQSHVLQLTDIKL